MAGNLPYELNKFGKMRRRLKSVLHNTKTSLADIYRSGYFSEGKSRCCGADTRCPSASCSRRDYGRVRLQCRSLKRVRASFSAQTHVKCPALLRRASFTISTT